MHILYTWEVVNAAIYKVVPALVCIKLMQEAPLKSSILAYTSNQQDSQQNIHIIL